MLNNIKARITKIQNKVSFAIWIWSLDIRILLKLVGDKPQPYDMVEQAIFVAAGFIPALSGYRLMLRG